MSTHLPSASFGPGNRGQQVGWNYGTINAEIHLPPERPETPPQPFATIPFSRDADFVDRGDILDQLRQRCSEPAGRVALVGLGGIGKSQLAIEFAHRTAKEAAEKWIFWIHAGTQGRVEEGFRAIADTVKLPSRNQPEADIPQLVYSWLSNERNGRWAIILDSADDGGVLFAASDGRGRKPLASYLPQSRNGSIVVTTRNRDLAYRLTGSYKNIIEIGPMVLADALLLLKKKLGPFSNVDLARDLVQALDRIPLAINQAAAYIQARSPMSSVEKYLAEFRKGERKRTQLLGHDAGDLRREGGASNAILTTWQISFEHIRFKKTSAANLLSLMSFFDRQGIALSLLKPVDAENVPPDSGSESNSSGDEADDGFEDDVAMLRNFCLVAINEDGNTLKMHGLVQLSMRRWLEADGLQDKFKNQFIKRMAAAFPTEDYSNWATCRRLFAHVEAAVDHRPAEGTMEEWARLMHNGGSYAWSQGRYEVAERMAGKARKSREKRLGEDDERTLESISLLAMVFLDKGLWAKAESLAVQVMETRKRVLGEEHPDTLTSMALLALTYSNQGKWKEAEELQGKEFEICSRVLEEEHPDTFASMGNLAAIYSNQGRWKEAELLKVQVMEARKRVLGEEDPDTLTSMDHLALTYWNQGRWEKAESLGVQVMEIRKRVFGEEHPSTLTTMGNLASTYWKQGRWKEAESLNVQVMETRKKVLGEEHPETLINMGNLASTYRNQGRWKEAESLEVRLMETLKSMLGEEHPLTLTSISNLAETYRNQGRWKEAESLGVQVMKTKKRVLGEEHPDTLTSMSNLAATYSDQGRWKDAESLEVQVMEIRKRFLGQEHPDTLTSMHNLAFTWKGQGRLANALALMKNCAQARQQVLGPEHPDTLSSLSAVSVWSS